MLYYNEINLQYDCWSFDGVFIRKKFRKEFTNYHIQNVKIAATYSYSVLSSEIS